MQIDKKKTYSVGNYTFVNFIQLNDDQIRQVWEWRNAPEIRRYMYNKDVIPFEGHLKFVESLNERNDIAYWLVSKDGEPIGVTNLTDINQEESSAELGYYMLPEKLNSGLGLEFAYNNLLFVFDTTIDCHTLHGGIHRTNINALTLDSYLGCDISLADVKEPSKEYVGWTANKEEFINEVKGKVDMRSFIAYVREHRKDFLV